VKGIGGRVRGMEVRNEGGGGVDCGSGRYIKGRLWYMKKTHSEKKN